MTVAERCLQVLRECLLTVANCESQIKAATDTRLKAVEKAEFLNSLLSPGDRVDLPWQRGEEHT